MNNSTNLIAYIDWMMSELISATFQLNIDVMGKLKQNITNKKVSETKVVSPVIVWSSR